MATSESATVEPTPSVSTIAPDATAPGDEKDADPTTGLSDESLQRLQDYVDLHDTGKLEEARTLLESIIAQEPGNGWLLNVLGDLDRDLGAYETALADYNRAIALGYEPNEQRRRLALTRAEMGDLAGARSTLDDLIAGDPDFALAWQRRGAIRLAMGDHAGAAADFSQAIAIYPRSASAICARGALRLADGEDDLAFADFRAGIELDRDFIECSLWLHVASPADAAKMDLAVMVYESRYPSDDFRTQMMLHYEGKVGPDDVIAQLDIPWRSVRMQEAAGAYYFLAEAAYRSGDSKTARSYYEKSVAEGAPYFVEYGLSKSMLERLK